MDGCISLLFGVEVPPTDVRTLTGEFLAPVAILLLLAVEELLLEDPGLRVEDCGFRTPLAGVV